MRYWEDDYRWNEGRDCCCNRCRDYCPWPPRPERPRKSSAQFVNTGEQQVIINAANRQEAIRFNSTPVKDERDIERQGNTNILLERGRYLVSYYLTVTNQDNDADTLVAQLKLDNDIKEYTVSRVRIDDENDDDSNKPLSKTNLIDVIRDSTLQLIVSSPGEASKFLIRDASIVIEKIS